MCIRDRYSNVLRIKTESFIKSFKHQNSNSQTSNENNIDSKTIIK